MSTEVLAGAANHGSAAVACSDHERGFKNRRENDNAVRFLDYLLGNVIGDVHNFLHYRAGILEALLFLVVRKKRRGGNQS